MPPGGFLSVKEFIKLKSFFGNLFFKIFCLNEGRQVEKYLLLLLSLRELFLFPNLKIQSPRISECFRQSQVSRVISTSLPGSPSGRVGAKVGNKVRGG